MKIKIHYIKNWWLKTCESIQNVWEVGTGGFNRRKKKYMLLWQAAGSLRMKIKIQ